MDGRFEIFIPNGAKIRTFLSEILLIYDSTSPLTVPAVVVVSRYGRVARCLNPEELPFALQIRRNVLISSNFACGVLQCVSALSKRGLMQATFAKVAFPSVRAYR